MEMYSEMGTMFWNAMRHDLQQLSATQSLLPDCNEHARERNDGVDYRRGRRLRTDLEKLGTRTRSAVQIAIDGGRRRAHEYEQEEIDDDVEVCFLLDLRSL